MEKRFKTPPEFRLSLQQRLINIARKENKAPQEIMKKVAFDRFLSRFFTESQSPWYLKGGYALELRFTNSRSTRDIDLVLKNDNSQNPIGQEIDIIGSFLFKYAKLKLDDYFEFIPSPEAMSLDNTPYGGKRYNIECRIAGKKFVSFHVDISINDINREPFHEIIKGQDWLDFAGIEAKKFQVLCIEEIFAEKLHAYTLPRDRINSRFRDLIDMYMFVNVNKIDSDKLSNCINSVFKRRKTHAIPDKLQTPPIEWENRFDSLAKECELNVTCEEAFNVIQKFLVENNIIQRFEEVESEGMKI